MRAIDSGKLLAEITDKIENHLVLPNDINYEINCNEEIEALWNLEIEFSKDLLPVYNCPGDYNSYSYLRYLCKEGLKKRFGSTVSKIYIDRLNYEIDIIDKMGFCNYFLVVWDFVKFAKEKGILVGPGRGSAAGSLVSYCLYITDIDPIKYNLLFERFLNPERVTMPDIDIDFEDTRRDEVVDYCVQKYGKKKVAEIITFGTLGAKETCSSGLISKWNEANSSLGQYDITSLIVNDLFGGKIMRRMASSGSHYYNLIDNEIIDLTVEQFLGETPDYDNGEEITREYLLSNEDTKNRYKKLLYNLKQSTRQVQCKKFKLIDENGQEYLSDTPGLLGGHKKLKIYGRLDCHSANRWLEKGKYANYRVFFANEEIAIKAGYRPCAICMPNEYKKWKNSQKEKILTLDKE